MTAPVASDSRSSPLLPANHARALAHQDREGGLERQVALVEVDGQDQHLPLGPVEGAEQGSPVERRRPGPGPCALSLSLRASGISTLSSRTCAIKGESLSCLVTIGFCERLAEVPEVAELAVGLDHQDRPGGSGSGTLWCKTVTPIAAVEARGSSLTTAQLDQRDGLEHLLEEQVAVGDERHRPRCRGGGGSPRPGCRPPGHRRGRSAR